jgi:flagellar motor switch protein FliM
VWSNIAAIQFELTETESNPQLVQIVPPNEVVVVIGFEIKMGNRAGTMSLCIPFNVIEPVMGKLSQQNWFTYARKAGNDSYAKAVQKSLSGAPLLVKVLLGHTTIKVEELIHLAPGDILQLEKPASGEMIVQIEGKNKFAGFIGQYKGKRAVRVKRTLEAGERVG